MIDKEKLVEALAVSFLDSSNGDSFVDRWDSDQIFIDGDFDLTKIADLVLEKLGVDK